MELCCTIRQELYSEGTISVSNFAIDLKSIRFKRAHAGCRDKIETQSSSQTRRWTNYRTRYCQTRFTAKPHGHCKRKFSGKQFSGKLFRMSFRRKEFQFRSFSTKRTSNTFFNGNSVLQLDYAWIAGKEQQEGTLRTTNSVNNCLMVIARCFRFPDTPINATSRSCGLRPSKLWIMDWLIVVWLMERRDSLANRKLNFNWIRFPGTLRRCACFSTGVSIRVILFYYLTQCLRERNDFFSSELSEDCVAFMTWTQELVFIPLLNEKKCAAATKASNDPPS